MIPLAIEECFSYVSTSNDDRCVSRETTKNSRVLLNYTLSQVGGFREAAGRVSPSSWYIHSGALAQLLART